jgi:hypothetical protein
MKRQAVLKELVSSDEGVRLLDGLFINAVTKHAVDRQEVISRDKAILDLGLTYLEMIQAAALIRDTGHEADLADAQGAD